MPGLIYEKATGIIQWVSNIAPDAPEAYPSQVPSAEFDVAYIEMTHPALTDETFYCVTPSGEVALKTRLEWMLTPTQPITDQSFTLSLSEPPDPAAPPLVAVIRGVDNAYHETLPLTADDAVIEMPAFEDPIRLIVSTFAHGRYVLPYFEFEVVDAPS